MTDTTKTEALRLADWLQAAVQTYPQMSEDEPGGYCTELDQVIDEAAAELRRLSAECEHIHEAAMFCDNNLISARGEATRLRNERDRLAAECEALQNVMQQTHDALKGLRAAKQRLEDFGPFTVRYVVEAAQFKLIDAGKAVDSALSAIDAAMGGKESQGGNGSGQGGERG